MRIPLQLAVIFAICIAGLFTAVVAPIVIELL